MAKEDNSGHRQRVRDKIKKAGINGMAEYEILEVILYGVFTTKDTKETAKKLLKKFKTL
jgi:DNA repair protein RadC